MSKMSKEKLRGLYADLASYVIVNIILFLLWALFGGGVYWPIWVIIIWGAILLVQASQFGFAPRTGATLPFLKSFSFLKTIFPFLNENWKETGLAEASRAVVHKLEEVGLEAAKTTSATAAKVATKTSNLTKKTMENREKTMKKEKSLSKKTSASSIKSAKKTVKAVKPKATKTKVTPKKPAAKSKAATKPKTPSKTKKATTASKTKSTKSAPKSKVSSKPKTAKPKTAKKPAVKKPSKK